MVATYLAEGSAAPRALLVSAHRGWRGGVRRDGAAGWTWTPSPAWRVVFADAAAALSRAAISIPKKRVVFGAAIEDA